MARLVDGAAGPRHGLCDSIPRSTTRGWSATGTFRCRPTSSGRTPPPTRSGTRPSTPARWALPLRRRPAFTSRRDLLEELRARGVEIAWVTLHVGLGTFLPIRTEEIEDHTMHEESFAVPAETKARWMRPCRDGRPVLAVGTTVVRTLESAWETIGAAGRGGPDPALHHAGLPIQGGTARSSRTSTPRLEPARAGERIRGTGADPANLRGSRAAEVQVLQLRGCDADPVDRIRTKLPGVVGRQAAAALGRSSTCSCPSSGSRRAPSHSRASCASMISW